MRFFRSKTILQYVDKNNRCSRMYSNRIVLPFKNKEFKISSASTASNFFILSNNSFSRCVTHLDFPQAPQVYHKEEMIFEFDELTSVFHVLENCSDKLIRRRQGL